MHMQTHMNTHTHSLTQLVALQQRIAKCFQQPVQAGFKICAQPAEALPPPRWAWGWLGDQILSEWRGEERLLHSPREAEWSFQAKPAWFLKAVEKSVSLGHSQFSSLPSAILSDWGGCFPSEVWHPSLLHP